MILIYILLIEGLVLFEMYFYCGVDGDIESLLAINAIVVSIPMLLISSKVLSQARAAKALKKMDDNVQR